MSKVYNLNSIYEHQKEKYSSNEECCNYEKCPKYNNCYRDYCYIEELRNHLNDNPVNKQVEKINNDIIDAIKSGKNILLTGSAGYGKSFLIKNIKKYLDIITLATTGIAAFNIGGCTLHSYFSLGIMNKPIQKCISDILSNEYKSKIILNTKFIAIDEISMLSGKNLNYMNEVLKGVFGNNLPFGGIQIIFVGDFFQLPPVEKEDTLNIYKNFNNIKDYCFNSQAWYDANIEVFQLTHNYRQEDKEFSELLNRIRVGYITQDDYNILYNRQIPINLNESDIPVLCSLNRQVDKINNRKLELLNEKLVTIEASFSTSLDLKKDSQKNLYNTIVANMKESSFLPGELNIKLGAKVMVTKNSKNAVNGNIGIIKEINLENNLILIETKNRRIIEVEKTEDYYISYRAKNDINVEQKLVTMRQFPLKLAWAISIHKSQGSTLDEVFIDFSGFFEVAQSYVALSRVRSLSGLYLKNLDLQYFKYSREVKQFYDRL